MTNMARTASLALLLSALQLHAAEPTTVDVTSAVVLAPAKPRGPQVKAIRMLIEEVEKRSRVRWPIATAWPKDQAVIAVGRAEQLRDMLAATDFVLPEDLGRGGAEGYLIAAGAS